MSFVGKGGKEGRERMAQGGLEEEREEEEESTSHLSIINNITHGGFATF